MPQFVSADRVQFMAPLCAQDARRLEVVADGLSVSWQRPSGQCHNRGFTTCARTSRQGCMLKSQGHSSSKNWFSSSKWRRPHLKPLAMETTLAWQHRWGAVLACSAAEVVSFSRTGQASSPMARRRVPVRPLGVASSLDWTWCTDLAELLRAMTRKDVRFRRMNLVVFTLDCLAFQAMCCDAGG